MKKITAAISRQPTLIVLGLAHLFIPRCDDRQVYARPGDPFSYRDTRWLTNPSN